MARWAYTRTGRAACKILAACLVAHPAGAAEGPVYEVFGRALAPIAAAFLGSTDNQHVVDENVEVLLRILLEGFSQSLDCWNSLVGAF